VVVEVDAAEGETEGKATQAHNGAFSQAKMQVVQGKTKREM
jgi:hypothetical protein